MIKDLKKIVYVRIDDIKYYLDLHKYDNTYFEMFIEFEQFELFYNFWLYFDLESESFSIKCSDYYCDIHCINLIVNYIKLKLNIK